MTPQQRWQQLSAREQRGLSVLAVLLTCLFIWFVGIAPAWQNIANAQIEQQRIADQFNEMQSLKAQVQELRQQTPLSLDDSWRVLQSLSGSEKGRFAINRQSDKALVQVKNAPPQAISAWLTNARTQAQATPEEAHLTQDEGNWSGTLIMRLPRKP